jgi:hypothetical protein
MRYKVLRLLCKPQFGSHLHNETLLIIFSILNDDVLEERDCGVIEALPRPFPGGTDRVMRHLIRDGRYPKQHSK